MRPPAPRVLLTCILAFSLPAAAPAAAEKTIPKKTNRELRREFQATYFDAKLFAAGIPADTVAYARVGALPALAEALQRLRAHTSADLPVVPPGQLPPKALKRDFSYALNPQPKGSARASVLALISATGEVSQVWVCDAEPRFFGQRLADTIAQWRYHPAKIQGVAVPAIVFETLSAGTLTDRYTHEIAFDQSDTADFKELKKSMAEVYDPAPFATSLPASVLVWPAELVASPIFQKGLKQLRQHAPTRFVAYPSTQPPITIDVYDAAIYPTKHKRKGKTGEAHVFLLVNSSGRIVKFYVAEATDEIFAAAAVNTLTNWVFTPAELAEKNVPFMTMQTVRFSLPE